MYIKSKKLYSVFLVLMTFIFTVGQSFAPAIANAQELNTTGFVDSFSIEKTKLNYGEQTQIKVNFTDKTGNQMKAEDTLTLSLPSELIGYTGTIPLKNDGGTVFGTCQVNTTDVVCTFTDTVEKLQNIRGHIYFTVQASNVATDQKKEVETNLGTNLKKQTVTIFGPTSGGSGSKPFFYKAGDIQPGSADQVRWFLNINLNKEYLSTDIVVSDSLQEGQTFNKDSFKIIVSDRESLSIEQFQDQHYGTVTFNNDNSFKVVINKDMASGRSFTISYTTTITESGKSQEHLKNDYKIDYQVLYKELVTESGSAVVKNTTSGGGADGDLPPKGTLRIFKHIIDAEEKVIPNVSFKLYTESGQQIGDTYTTNSQGIVEVPNLDAGNYYVQEIAAPDYLNFDPEAKVSFTIDADAAKGVKLMIPNKVKTTFVTGTKTWSDNNSSDRPSSINVDLLLDGKVIQTQEVTAANDWEYTFNNLAAFDADGNEYKYEVKEQPVAGYKSAVNGFDITNTKVGQTTVEGTKTWKNDNASDRPSSIKVDLLQNGQVIQTQDVTATNDWKYTFANLTAFDANGNAYTYEVKEQPVAGYKSAVNGFDIINTKLGQTTVEGTKTWKNDNASDRPSSIKVDLLQDGQVIQTQEVTSANDWKYTFDNLAAYDADGKAYMYTVKEQPVAGYKSDVDGYNITNTKNEDPVNPPTTPPTTPPPTPPTKPIPPIPPTSSGQTSVEGTKTWKGDNEADRPSSIKVDLFQNGMIIKTQEVTAANGWKYIFADLAVNDPNGKAYTYEVREQPVAGYQSEVNGYDITNTKITDPDVTEYLEPLPPPPTKDQENKPSNPNGQNSGNVLPQTGEESHILYQLIGYSAILLGAVLLLIGRKRKFNS